MSQARSGIAGVWIAVAVSAPFFMAGCTAKTSATKASPSASAAAPSSMASTTPVLDLASLTAEELLNKARLAASESETLHVKGAGKDGSETVALDLSFGKSGSSGTISIDSLPITLLSRDGSTWFKATDAFWKAQAGSKAASIIATVNGRWVKANPGDQTFKDLTAMADRQALLDQFITMGGSVAKGASATINGTDCFALTGGVDGTLYVATADGRPIEVKRSVRDEGSLDFDYGAVTIPEQPSMAEVLDSTQLSS